MNICDFTIQTIASACRHQWKWLLGITLTFFLIGTASGFLFAGRATAEGKGEAQAWDTIALTGIPQNANYPTKCYTYLSQQSQLLYDYLEALGQNPTISSAQAAQLQQLGDKVLSFQETTLPMLEQALDRDNIVVLLQSSAMSLDDLAREITQYSQQLAQENHLLISFAANGDTLTLTIQHTTRTATWNEAFSAFLLIFGMVGLCAGFYFSLCREARQATKA